MSEQDNRPYWEKPEFFKAKAKKEKWGQLAWTLDDFLAIRGIPTDDLKNNPSKTEDELMTAEEIANFLRENQDLINEFTTIQDNDFVKSALLELTHEFASVLKYLKAIGRLPEEFDPEPEKQISLGMKLSDINFEILKEIVQLYEEVVGGDYAKRFRSHDPGKAVKYVVEGPGEWRFGSRLIDSNGRQDVNGKLFLRPHLARDENSNLLNAIRIYFDPNTIEGEEADKLRKEFQYAVNRFLIKKGLEVELPRR
ncbi:hypothetical protein HYW46_05590 [Candidatus Daviesbacteria bacterium]|nr:hypothetical protein [Candidatus Daviesbacteria bacterium]